MRATGFSSLREGDDLRRRRAVSFALAVGVHVLLLLMLLRLAPPFETPPVKPPLQTVLLPPETADQLKTHSARAQKRTAPAARAPHPIARAAARPTPQPTKSAAPWVINPDLAQFDLRKLPTSPPADQLATNSDARPAPERNDDDVIGTGPGGQELWQFRGWARPPTTAEIYPYLPKDHDTAGHEVFKREGWGSVACKIVEGNRLEDCEELAESTGSGFARALRQMAWQFRLLPPKRNGEVVYNTWINLCFTFEQDGGMSARRVKGECAGPWRGVFGHKGGAAPYGPTRGSGP